MNRRIACAVALAAIGSSAMTGCGQAKQAGKDPNEGVSLVPAMSTPANAGGSTEPSDEPVPANTKNAASFTMHVNALVVVTCRADGSYEVRLFTDGRQDSPSKYFSFEDATVDAGHAGYSCAFKPSAKQASTSVAPVRRWRPAELQPPPRRAPGPQGQPSGWRAVRHNQVAIPNSLPTSAVRAEATPQQPGRRSTT